MPKSVNQKRTKIHSRPAGTPGRTALHDSATFEVGGTTGGFLPPRMTTVQVNAILNPAIGLVVFDTTVNKLKVRGATAWETITSA